MTNEYTIQIDHDGRSFSAAVDPEDDLDQLLLKSLDYFGVDPEEKSEWTLVRAPRERRTQEEDLTLADAVSGQLDSGDRVRLRPRNVDREEPATGSY